jgi:hypothetical protein
MAKVKSKVVEKPKGKVKRVLLAIAIALVLAFFVGYGVNTFYKEPIWDNYCKNIIYDKPFNDRASCEGVGGNWTEPVVAQPVDGAVPAKVVPQAVASNQYLCSKSIINASAEPFVFNCVLYEDVNKVTGWCDPQYSCNKSFQAANEVHSRFAFIILAVIGILVVILSTLFLKEDSVSYGLLGGGILTILYGTMRYWGVIPDMARFFILGFVLLVLIWIGYKKLR